MSTITQAKIRIDDICEVSLYAYNVILLEFFRHTVSDEEDTALAQKIYERSMRLLDADPYKTFNIIFCVTHLGDSTQHSGHQARVIYRKLYEHPRINKMAIVHQSNFISVVIGYLAEMLNRFTKKKDALKYFSKRNEALTWITA